MNRAPGLSVRIKLTLSYAGFLLVAGIALFAVGFLLLRFVPDGNVAVVGGSWAPNRSDLLEVFLRYAWWCLGLLVVIGLVGGWILAGIVLRPLGRIADAARRARDGDLEHRVALTGRRDELTELGDALDAMLDRVQLTIDAERRFAANASHELRTPHAIIRTIVEVAQADPDGRDLDVVLSRIGATNERAIRTTEALLGLARAGRGAGLATSAVDLSALTSTAIDDVRMDAAARGIRISTSLEPAVVSGSADLLSVLVANLVGNAVVHNLDDGWVRVSLASIASSQELVVAGSGPVLAPALAATLTEPFVRGAGRSRAGSAPDGAGLGLAIVDSIVRAHHGTLAVVALPAGGLQVRVRLPR